MDSGAFFYTLTPDALILNLHELNIKAPHHPCCYHKKHGGENASS
jgi:hypothetical protein